MPFGLKWPFDRKNKANQTSATASESLNVQRTPASGAPSTANEPRTFELGAEVMNRATEFGTLPTLGADAGLSIAQNVGEAGRFIQQLPNSDNLISVANLPDVNDFVASLASLSSFTDLESTPVLMGELVAPNGLTDELPPLGGLPNQLPGLRGVAPGTPDANAGVVNMVSTPVTPPVQSSEPTAVATSRGSTAPSVVQRATAETPATLASERPIETSALLNTEQPLVAPLEPSIPEMPPLVPANFVSPAPVIESGSEIVETSVPVESSTASDVSSRNMPSLALNDFTEALPLINLPGETSKGEVPAITTSAIHESPPALDLPVGTGDFEPLLTLPELTSSASEHASAAESTSPSEPLSISRYAEDLPLPAPIAPREEAPTILNAPAIELPVVAPLPTLSAPEEMTAPFEPLSLTEVAQDFLAMLSPVDQFQVDQSPVDASVPASEPSLSIKRYAEDLPLIDLGFGWREFEPQAIEPSFGEVRTMAGETMPSLATSAPERPLPSNGEQHGRVGARTEPAPISISRYPSDLPLNRSTTLNQVTQIQRFSLGNLAQNLPSLSGATDNLPSLGGLTENLPSLGGIGESIGNEKPQLPSLGGLASSQMPLPPSISDAIGGLSGAGQEALGQITSMAPSMLELPAMPQLPSIEKLTDQVWREIQKKLKIERERTRGLA